MSTDPSIDAGPPPTVVPADPPRRRFPWLRAAQLVGVAAVVQVGVLFLVTRPDHVLVEHVEFRGESHVDAAALRHLVDIQNGTTMWTVDLDRAVHGAERHPWVRAARAYRQWPDTVVVEVDEYRPVALLADSAGLHYVDADGTPFFTARGEDLDYPILTGIDPALADAHPDLPRVITRDALSLLDDLDTAGLVPRDRVSEVAFSATVGFTVQVRDGARLIFGVDKSDRPRELQHLQSLVDQGVDLDGRVLVDLEPQSLAIVRPLGAGATVPSPAPGGEG